MTTGPMQGKKESRVNQVSTIIFPPQGPQKVNAQSIKKQLLPTLHHSLLWLCKDEGECAISERVTLASLVELFSTWMFM